MGDACELGFKHMTDSTNHRQTLSMPMQNKSIKKRIGRMRMKFILPIHQNMAITNYFSK
jgi:hypothetical protein